MTETATSTIEETHVETTPELDDGDHERFAHYVSKEGLDRAIFLGEEVRALCGKVWLPLKDPSKFPVCPECKTLYESFIDDITPDMEG
jgi:hypothetical protein